MDKTRGTDRTDDTDNVCDTDKVRADAAPKTAYRIYEIAVTPTGVSLPDGTQLTGALLARHLDGCQKCAALAATLGHGVDRELRRLQRLDMAAAVSYDQAANRLIEEICDELSREITALAAREGLRATSRYSPGYGDFGLENQSKLLMLTQSRTETGITLSPQNLLLPQKSVTAVIGLGRAAKSGGHKCEGCPSAAKCKKRGAGV